MNLDRKVKLLLLIVNRLGVEMNYEVITRYNDRYDNMQSEYHLKTWHYKLTDEIDEKTGEPKKRWYCIDKVFKRIDQVAKYLIAIKESKEGKNNAKG